VDAEFIRELFGEFGQIQVRRMFGGAGLFADGLMFGLVADQQIYLKAEAASVPKFEAEDCGPFGYSTKHGRRVLTSYRRLPARLYDEPEELAQWAKVALAAARAAAVKPARKPDRAKRA
jgi:DNA transformation protein